MNHSQTESRYARLAAVSADGQKLIYRTMRDGRQELWEDSPAGWPQRWGENTSEPNAFRLSGRPISQWSRLAAGRSDNLGTKTTAPNGWPHQP